MELTRSCEIEQTWGGHKRPAPGPEADAPTPAANDPAPITDSEPPPEEGGGGRTLDDIIAGAPGGRISVPDTSFDVNG